LTANLPATYQQGPSENRTPGRRVSLPTR
jgi:hypothetical protein